MNIEIKNRKPMIFIISGKARHGKDTVALKIAEIYSEQNKKTINIAFASYIKEYTKKVTNWDGSEETKETVREVMQQIGTEIIRNNLDNYFFINRIIEDIKVYSYFFDVITISDARIKEEIESIKSKFEKVISINVYRPNFDPILNKKEQKHLTETDLDDYDNYDYEIINNGTLEDLKLKIKNIIDKEMM